MITSSHNLLHSWVIVWEKVELRVLRFLTCVDSNRVVAVELGAIPFFTNLLYHPDARVSVAALCGLGNLANAGGEPRVRERNLTFTEKVRRAFAFSDCFPLLLKYIRSAKPFTKCFALNFFATLSTWRMFCHIFSLIFFRTDSWRYSAVNEKHHRLSWFCRANTKRYGSQLPLHWRWRCWVSQVWYNTGHSEGNARWKTIDSIFQLWGLFTADCCPHSSEDWSVITETTRKVLEVVKPKFEDESVQSLFARIGTVLEIEGWQTFRTTCTRKLAWSYCGLWLFSE